MTTPVAPDIPSVDTFGGFKENADGVVDPNSEMDAADHNRLIAQVAMISHTAEKAWARFTISAGVATCVDHEAVWGNTSSVKPSASQVIPGQWTVHWATAYDDLQETPESHSVQIRATRVQPYGASTYANARPNTANTVVILFTNAAGTLTDPTEFTVWIY